jgi:rod shape-determining protein MreD
MRWLTFLILLYFMSALQSAQLGSLPAGHLLANNWPGIDYLPLLAVFYAMFAGEAAAPLAALACGAMYDLVQGDYLGTTMIPLALIALLILRIRLSIFREHIVSQMLMTLIALLIFAVLEAVFRRLIGAPLDGRGMWTHMGRLAGNAFYTALVSPLFYWLFFRFKMALGFTPHGSRTRH